MKSELCYDMTLPYTKKSYDKISSKKQENQEVMTQRNCCQQAKGLYHQQLTQTYLFSKGAENESQKAPNFVINFVYLGSYAHLDLLFLGEESHAGQVDPDP